MSTSSTGGCEPHNASLEVLPEHHPRGPRERGGGVRQRPARTTDAHIDDLNSRDGNGAADRSCWLSRLLFDVYPHLNCVVKTRDNLISKSSRCLTIAASSVRPQVSRRDGGSARGLRGLD